MDELVVRPRCPPTDAGGAFQPYFNTLEHLLIVFVR